MCHAGSLIENNYQIFNGIKFSGKYFCVSIIVLILAKLGNYFPFLYMHKYYIIMKTIPDLYIFNHNRYLFLEID